MDELDLSETRFTQADVLAILPDLKAKTLQNWIARDVFETGAPRPGRQGKVLYSAHGIIDLAFMHRLAGIGFSPTEAFKIAEQIELRAAELHSQRVKQDNPWTIEVCDHVNYQRGYITRHEGDYFIRIQDGGLTIERLFGFPDVYITVEVDVIIIDTLRRIYALVQGKPLSNEPVVVDQHGVTVDNPEDTPEYRLFKVISAFRRPELARPPVAKKRKGRKK